MRNTRIPAQGVPSAVNSRFVQLGRAAALRPSRSGSARRNRRVVEIGLTGRGCSCRRRPPTPRFVLRGNGDVEKAKDVGERVGPTSSMHVGHHTLPSGRSPDSRASRHRPLLWWCRSTAPPRRPHHPPHSISGEARCVVGFSRLCRSRRTFQHPRLGFSISTSFSEHPIIVKLEEYSKSHHLEGILHSRFRLDACGPPWFLERLGTGACGYDGDFGMACREKR